MSLTVYVAHSGQKAAADPTKVSSSLDALRAWIQDKAGVAAGKQVLLTSRGKAVRAQTLLTEAEVYVFDATLFAPSSSPASADKLSLVPDLPLLAPAPPPDSIADHDRLQSWSDLFQRRLDWANALRARYADLVAHTRRCQQERAVIARSLGVAAMSLGVHLRATEQRYRREEGWVDGLLKEQEAHVDTWEKDLDLLSRIPARQAFARFVQSRNDLALQDPAPAANVTLRDSAPAADVTLQDFVRADQVRDAAASAQGIMTRFAKRVVDLQTSLSAAAKQSGELSAAVQTVQHSQVDDSDEPPKLLEEVDVIVKKMSNDLDHVRSLSDSPQGSSRASKMALLHTRNYLPHLDEFCRELNPLVQRSIQQRNNDAQDFLRHMQSLSSIESRLAQIHTGIKNLGMSQDEQHAFDTLNILSKLPHVYGSLMVEAVRRREWTDKMKADSATLAEEMATYQEEEDRRRTKWLRSVDDVVNPSVVEDKPLGIEVNLQAGEPYWPEVRRQELQQYLGKLIELDLPKASVQSLSNAIRDLDRPTKKQIKHAKTFKNGSMHEAAFGSTSLMLRGEDEYRVLRDANSKLDEELKGQKSRVRRLEDILHRQAHMQRVNGGEMFRPSIELVSDMVIPNPPSPRPSDELARQTVGSRRTSSSLTGEEGRLAKRLVSLESELRAAREHNSFLEKDAEARKQTDADGRREIDEAVSTKKDIMQNMEALQREFANERRILEQDLNLARNRVEELEDEVDRIIGSRDQEKSGTDARAKSLEAELEKVKNHASEAELRYQTELGEVRSSLKTKQDENRSLREELQAAKRAQDEAERVAQSAVNELRQAHSVQISALRTAHIHLAPCTPPPEEYVDLASALEDLARRSADHVKELTDAIALAKSDAGSLQSQCDSQKSELSAAKAKQSVTDAELVRLQDDMEAEKAHARSLAACLEDEREQLRSLRSKFADGETGADVLRQRVADEEARVVRLSEKLAQVQSRAGSLEDEIARIQKKLDGATAAADSAGGRLSQRGSRAKEIAQKLYAQNARLLRLLEALGFVVSQKDNAMVIERASRVSASTLDLAASVNRTVSLSSPPPTRKASAMPDDPSSLTFLHWTEASNAADEESQYLDFMKHISLFSTDTFSEAISKRLRDFEYTARKWQKEARGYKDKNTRLQADCSAKIAVRDFREGDLALFLPTKGQRTGAWAAFNINAPHHFLREREGMVLSRREWLVARITRIEERVVDLSKPPASSDGRSIGSTSVDAASLDEMNDNPFDLSDGLTWYLVHAAEDKPGAPSTPGLSKSTVASSSVDAKGSIRMKKKGDGEAFKTLNKSLDSRRSSSNSKKGVSAGFLVAQTDSQRMGSAEDTLRRKRSNLAEGSGTAKADVGTDDRDQQFNMTSSRTMPSLSHPFHPTTAAVHPGRSASPSKSVRSLARHLGQQGGRPSSSSSSSGAKHQRTDGNHDESGGGGGAGGGGGDAPAWNGDAGDAKDVEARRPDSEAGARDDKDKKKGLWNLFSAEYEI